MDASPSRSTTRGSLGDERQVVEGLQLGTVHLTVTSTGPLGGFVPDMNVLDLPFLFRDAAHAYKVLDGEIGRGLLDKFEAVGIKGLAFWENGFRHVTTTKKPVEKPSDLKGLKIRVMENRVHQAAFRQLGADATPMAWGEVFTSLQQGLLDAQENPIPIVSTFKLYEVQKYLSLTAPRLFPGSGADEQEDVGPDAAGCPEGHCWTRRWRWPRSSGSSTGARSRNSSESFGQGDDGHRAPGPRRVPGGHEAGVRAVSGPVRQETSSSAS